MCKKIISKLFFLNLAVVMLLGSCLSANSGSIYKRSPPKEMGKIISTYYNEEAKADKIAKITVSGNYYEMGYQQGYLLAEGVKATTAHDWFIAIGNNMSGGLFDNNKYLSKRKYKILDMVLGHFARKNEPDIPIRFREQMKGVADGAINRLEEIYGVSYAQLSSKSGKTKAQYAADLEKRKEIFGDISYDTILWSNILFDVLMSLAYPIEVPKRAKMQTLYDLFYTGTGRQEKRDLAELQKALEMSEFNLSVEQMHSCDGIVVTGPAAKDNGAIHARSFMNSYIISQHSIYIEYQPEDAYYKVINLTVPSIVGSHTGMNDQGLSVGLDMVSADKARVSMVGMGSLFKIRRLLEECGTLTEAVDQLQSYTGSKTGVPWIYAMAGKVGARGTTPNCKTYKPDDWGGVVVEDAPFLSVPRWGDWEDTRFDDSQYTTYDYTIAIKEDPWKFFDDGKYSGTMRLISAEKTLYNKNIGVREVQGENNPWLLTFTNVFIMPEMQSSKKVKNRADHDSTYRHERLTILARDLLEERTPELEGYDFTSDNKIDFQEAKYLVNYISPRKNLNPYWAIPMQRQRWNHKDGENFPKEIFDEVVEFCGRYYWIGEKHITGSRTVFDNSNLKIASTWGIWEQDWVEVEFDK
ncbi:MAG: hypothetical protein JXR63_13785 [Spirochaetales bacterium]|nr:hypothetical protein [Spirochaetales bacterium]